MLPGDDFVADEEIEEPDLPLLDLRILAEGMRGLTPTAGAYLAEAAAVCLDDQGHPIRCILTVTGSFDARFHLDRQSIDEQDRSTHWDTDRATENGACGVGILVVSQLTHLEVLRQSRKGTGFDYYLVPRGTFLFRNRTRLEVTGIRNDGMAEVQRRVAARKARFEHFGDQGIPDALIVVIEFGRPVAHVVRL